MWLSHKSARPEYAISIATRLGETLTDEDEDCSSNSSSFYRLYG